MGGREGTRQSRDESPSPGWRAAKKGLGGPCRQLCLPGMRRGTPLPPVLGVVKVELQVVAARLLYFRGEGYGDHFPGVNTELEEESRAERDFVSLSAWVFSKQSLPQGSLPFHPYPISPSLRHGQSSSG